MFKFNNDYDDHEQVRQFMDGYRAVRAELDAAGKYPYNDSFKGRISGIEGPDEDTAIYLLQTLYRLDELAEQIAAFLADGGEQVESLNEVRRGTVVEYGFYMGGTGWHQWEGARLVPRNGKPYAVLPKGKRTHGSLLSGKVLIRQD